MKTKGEEKHRMPEEKVEGPTLPLELGIRHYV